MERLAERHCVVSIGSRDTSYHVCSEPKPLDDESPRHALYRNADTLSLSLRAWWEQRATDSLWLAVLALLNASLFAWRYTCFPRDPVAGCWTAIAKGSAELALLNTAAAVLAVCYRFVGRCYVALRRNACGTSHLPPLDKPLALHKLAGIAVVAASLLHSLAWLIIITRLRQCSLDEWRASSFHTRLASIREAPSSAAVLRELPVWTGLAMLACLAVSAPFCVPCVRDRSFQYFAQAHSALVPFVLILLIHGIERWTGDIQAPFWLVPALVVYGIERMHRVPLLLSPLQPVLSRRSRATVGLAMRQGDVLVLQLNVSESFRRRLEPGMYVFVAVPVLSSWEWHPFSVASAPEDSAVHLHIRLIGDWTNALSQVLLAESQAAAGDDDWIQLPHELKVHLGGPVPSPTTLFREYTCLALMSTGVGVTPHLSVLRHLLHSRRLHRDTATADRVTLRMIWSTRQVEHVQSLLDTLDEFAPELADSPDTFVIALHVTGLPSHCSEVPESQRRLDNRLVLAARQCPCLRVEFARVSWAAAIDNLFSPAGGQETDSVKRGGHTSPPPLGVFICSHASLSKQLKRSVTTAAAVAHGRTSGKKRRVDVFAEGF